MENARFARPKCLRYHLTPIATVYIGLGSNIDAAKNLPASATLLKKTFNGIRFSHVYRSEPMELKDQPEFFNAAAVFESELTPEKILGELQKIEKKLKKNPPKRFGPRTIDLDLLLYGTEIRLEDELTLPHLRLHARRFVLEPLVELGAGDMPHPGFERLLRDFLADVKHQKCERVEMAL